MEEQISLAVKELNSGGVVAMPTETVYGLAARIDSETALKKVFSLKKRPFFDPLIVHVASIEQARSCVAEWNEACQLLAEKFWPGPLTLVLPKAPQISGLITSGLETVAVRWPRHPVAQELIEKTGCPLAAPSANLFGRTSPTKAQHVRDEFGDGLLVLEGAASEIGIESTVLSVKKQNGIYTLSILRKGSVLASQISGSLEGAGFKWQWGQPAAKNESPGNMKHHYMPSVPLVICRNPQMKLSELTAVMNQKLHELPDEVEGVKIVKPKTAVNKIEFLKLSENPVQAARELYSQLRSVSQRSPDALCFLQTPGQSGEMWESIFDRLYKAASLILD